MDLLALIVSCVFKSKAGDASGGLLRDDLQALDNSGHDFVL